VRLRAHDGNRTAAVNYFPPSQHPETAGLVNERKVGQWSYYRISDGVVIDMMNHARLLKKK